MNAKYIASMNMAVGDGERASDFLGSARVNAKVAAEYLGFLRWGENPANGLSASENLRKTAALLRAALIDVESVIGQLDSPAL